MRFQRPALLLAAFLAGVLLWRGASLLTESETGVRIRDLEATPCWFDVPSNRIASCGYLTVPDRRDRGLSTLSKLAVAVFSPPAGVTKRDPIVFLNGGPGGAFGFSEGNGWWWNWVEAVALAHGREFIAVDPRGVGRSEPRVDCPSLRALEAKQLQREMPAEDEDDEWLDAVAACRDRLVGDGIDLSSFGTAQSAADTEDLRCALGIERWNLYGISYGTRVALTVARDHPTSVRSVVLDSLYPPEAQPVVDGPAALDAALRLAWMTCPECADTRAAIERVVARLDERSARVIFKHPDTLEPFDVVLNGDRLLDALVVALSGHTNVRHLAEQIAALDRGVADGAGDLVRDYWLALEGQDFSYPVNFSVECREQIPFNDFRAAAAQAQSFPLVGGYKSREAERMRRICDLWGLLPESPRQTSPALEIPALILAGTFDPVTPPAWAEKAAQRLPRSHLLTLATGHSVTDADPCSLQLIAAFLDDPDKRPTADCYALGGAGFLRP